MKALIVDDLPLDAELTQRALQRCDNAYQVTVVSDGEAALHTLRESCDFDVILLDPPWEEYQTRVVGSYVPNEDLTPWTMEELPSANSADVAKDVGACCAGQYFS